MHRGHAVTGHNQLDMYRVTWDERHWGSAWTAANKGLDAMVKGEYLDPIYTYEWLHDLEDFTGDSRIERAVLNVADNIIGKPLGTRRSYPALYVFGHAYELTGDPKYIAWGKGKLQMHLGNLYLGPDRERYGRVSSGEQIHMTRLLRQVPGFLYQQKLAEEKHGPIAMRTEPIPFIYERGPIYFLEEQDCEFPVWLHLSFSPRAKSEGEVRILGPDGRTVVKQPVAAARMGKLGNKLVLTVPKDGRSGIYRLDLDVETEGGSVQGRWGIESPVVRKVAYGLTKFTYFGGHVFFYVPRGTKSFRLRVDPRPYAGSYGQPVVYGPDGAEVMRLDGLHPAWLTVRPKPAQTGGLWGVNLYAVGIFRMAGLPPFVYSDRSEFFLPEGPLVIAE